MSFLLHLGLFVYAHLRQYDVLVYSILNL